MNKYFIVFIFMLFFQFGNAQGLTIDGYVFESGNRGFLQNAVVLIEDLQGNELGKTYTDEYGHFVVKTAPHPKYKITATKQNYETRTMDVNGGGFDEKDKIFLKIEMLKSPGYDFEITLAEARDEEGNPADGISGARIDVYNNTTEEEVFVLEDYIEPEFSVHLKKGNHYTMLIRKEGYIAKRVEAYVDVNGCILCVEGFGDLNPGVAENLSRNNTIGVLLANIELEKIRIGKKLEVQNIYYDFGSARLTSEARVHLQTLITMMADTPELLVELGSHTDARGGNEANMKLSEKRAQSAVKYIRDGGIAAYRISARGYGENILKNQCADSVNCSEAEHAENRRTELKIVGLSDRKSRIKSLAEIKQAEKAEAMLAEFQFGGQISLPEGMSIEDLSDEEVNQMLKDLNEVKEENFEIEEGIEEMLSNEIDQTGETMESEVVESNINQSTEIISEKINEVETSAMESNEEVAHSVDQTSGINDAMETKMQEVKEVVGTVQYRIVIHESEEAIAEEGGLYSKHSDLLEYFDLDKKYKYLIGSFDKEKEALKFLKGAVRLAYPDAYMVKYADGEIVP